MKINYLMELLKGSHLLNVIIVVIVMIIVVVIVLSLTFKAVSDSSRYDSIPAAGDE